MLYKYNINKFLGPLTNIFLNIGHQSEFSKWREKNPATQFNDFYSDWNYQKRYNLYDFVYTSGHGKGAINFFEFGVRGGDSFKWWVNKNQETETRFYGFDTFTGLPEDWLNFKAGAMSEEGNFPDIKDPRVKFIKGLFQETLSDFLKQFDNTKKNVIHLDADLYTSTLYVLTVMDGYLKPGDIIMFDDFGVPSHEFLAFSNYTAAYQRDLELIGAANNYFFTAFLVKK